MIDTEIETVRAELHELRIRVEALENASGDFLPDSELDGQYGNPTIKFMPKRGWGGADHKGEPFSLCPPALLDAYADTLSWMAEHPTGRALEDPKLPEYNRRDAKRARSWARRLRAGYKPPELRAGRPTYQAPTLPRSAPAQTAAPEPPAEDDDIPF